MNLSGKQLVVAGFGDPDYEYQLKVRVAPNGSVSFVSGFSLDVLLLLQLALNFTYSSVDGVGWVGELPNGSLTGIGGVVAGGRGDLGINPSTIVGSRLSRISYLHPIMTGGLAAALTQPPGSSIRDLVTSSFTFSVWITAFGTSALAVVLVKVIGVLRERRVFQGEDETSVVLGEPVFWILLTFCQRGIGGSVSSYALRIVYTSIIVTTVVGYTAYSAALVSTLTTDVIPIKSFAGLLETSLPIVGDSSVDFTHDFIRKMNRGRKVGSTRESSFIDARSGVKGVMRGEIAFATFQDALYGIYRDMAVNEDYVCHKLFHFLVAGTQVKGAMIVAKNSPYKEVFNGRLVMLRERGYLKRAMKKWEGVTFPRCSPLPSGSFQPLTLQDVVTAFFAFAAGVGGSVGLVSLEGVFRQVAWRNLLGGEMTPSFY